MTIGVTTGDTRVILDQGGLNEVLRGSQGPVAKELLRVGAEIDGEAIRLLSNDLVNVVTGFLRASTTHVLTMSGGELAVVVGSGAPYSIHVHKFRPYLEIAARNVGIILK